MPQITQPNIVPVVLAGGQGTRFWPISRSDHPKQFLSISENGESLIQATINRLELLAKPNSMLVVTNVNHEQLVKKHVPQCNLIAEPIAKNTAASIGVAALWCIKNSPGSVMAVFPADHHIENTNVLVEKIKIAAAQAQSSDSLITLGVRPSYPNTAYGYIRRGEQVADSIYEVSRFFEKPSLERARKYLEDGNFYWNSGIFIWKPEIYLEAIKSYLPELHSGLMELKENFYESSKSDEFRKIFDRLESISVDFGILEHAQNCLVVEAEDLGWNDVGSWDAWANHFKADSNNNLLHGQTLALDSDNSVVYSNDRLIALLGCSDLVVIDSKDALLVCPRSRVQDVKEVVTKLIEQGRTDLT